MNFKKCIIFIVITVFLFTIASVSAADMNETTTTSTEEYEIELSQNDEKEITGQNEKSTMSFKEDSTDQMSVNVETGNEILEISNNEEVLGAPDGTFGNLQDIIDNAHEGDTIELGRDYINIDHYNGGNGIVIRKPITIDGHGFTIDANNFGRTFYVQSGSVTIKNINFINNNYAGFDGGAVYFNGQGTVSNCNFTNNTATNGAGGAVYFYEDGNVTNCNFVNNTAKVGGAVYFRTTGDVTNCNFTGNNATRGGAVYIMGNVDVTNCNFTGNTVNNDGGAVYFLSTGTVSNCNFTNNTAANGYGGAIRMFSGSVENCNFINNTATYGGAIRMGSGSVENCNFTNNTATNGAGGAVYFYEDGNVTNCNFTDNTATYGNGGAVYFNSTGDVTNCNFTGNTADRGGAVYFNRDGTVTNCNFTNNNASDDGGAVYFVNSGDVTNCNFTGNNATTGGAVYFWNTGDVSNCNFVNNTATYAGAINIGPGTVTNCNFVNNTATYAGAIDIVSGAVTNCNFTNNRASSDCGAINIGSGTVSNCNFTNNTATYGYGGAIRMFSGSVENCNFTDNSANYGGAVYFVNSGDVTNCNFTGNNAAWGSAIYFYKYSSSNTLTISDSIFLNNRANVDYDTALNVTINENNITITFVGQNNLLNAIYSRGDVNVTFSNVTYWGAKGKEIANSTRSGSNKEAGQNITIAVVVNDKIVFNGVKVTDDNGTIFLNIKTGENYFIGVRHNEDSYYTEAEKIISQNIKFHANVTSISTNNKTVNITAKSNIPNDIIQGKLLFILPNGTEISANYSCDGVWWAVYEFSNSGVYNVGASYSSGEVNVTEGTITILADVPIIVSDMSITFGDDAVVVVSVPDAINGQNITIAVNSSSKNVTVKNGEANVTFTNLAFGDYVIVVEYLGDGLNSANSTTAKLTVNKATPIIEVQSYDATYPGDVVITVKSDVAGLYVVKVGNVSQNVTLEAGVEQNVTFTGLGVNEEGYVVNVTNADLENCTLSVNDTGIVKVMQGHSYIDTDGLITVYNSGGILFVSLTGIDGEPLSGRGIKVNITGKTYTIITNASGIAGLPINLKAGLHPAYVWFNGDSTYAPSENLSTSVEVYTDSRITGNKDLVKKQGGSEPFKVRALDKYGKPVGAYAKVKMTVAGKTYTVFTDANGYASLPINLKVGKYKITTVYGGTTVTNTITVKK